MNGPLNGRYIDIGPTLYSAIDVCDPIDGSEPQLFRMVQPNNGIWTYNLMRLEEVDEYYYDAIRIDQQEILFLGPEQWTKVGGVEIYNPTLEEVPISRSNTAVEFDGWRIRFGG